MKAFRFPLEKVLDWRRLQMRAEEEKLTLLQQQLELLTRRVQALTSAEVNSKLGLIKMTQVQASDLHALPAFQAQIKKERAILLAERLQFERRIAVQRTRLLKARKDFRVLENLRERRKDAWTYSYNRELEEQAADAHLAKLIRGES